MATVGGGVLELRPHKIEHYFEALPLFVSRASLKASMFSYFQIFSVNILQEYALKYIKYESLFFQKCTFWRFFAISRPAPYLNWSMEEILQSLFL